MASETKISKNHYERTIDFDYDLSDVSDWIMDEMGEDLKESSQLFIQAGTDSTGISQESFFFVSVGTEISDLENGREYQQNSMILKGENLKRVVEFFKSVDWDRVMGKPPSA